MSTDDESQLDQCSSLEGIQLPSCLLDLCARAQPQPGGHPTTQVPAGPLCAAQPQPGGHPTTQLPAGFLWASSTRAWRASNYPAACWIFVGEFNQSLEGIQLPSCLLDLCGELNQSLEGIQLPSCLLDFCGRVQPEPGGHPTTQLPAGPLWASSTRAWRASNYPAACWIFVGELNHSLEGIQLPSCLLDFCGRVQPEPGGHPTTQLPAGPLWASSTRAWRASNYPAACCFWTFVGEFNQTSCRSFLKSST